MASGFPTGAYCSKASQTPMSFCAAGSVSTCTRTREGMSSIVLLGFLVSMGFAGAFRSPLADWQSWLKTASGDGPLRSTGLARRSVTAVVMGTYSEKTRGGEGRPEPGEGPGRLNHRRSCPILPWRRRREIRGTAKRQTSPPPRHAHAFHARTGSPCFAQGCDAPTGTHSAVIDTCCDVVLGVASGATERNERSCARSSESDAGSCPGETTGGLRCSARP